MAPTDIQCLTIGVRVAPQGAAGGAELEAHGVGALGGHGRGQEGPGTAMAPRAGPRGPRGESLSRHPSEGTRDSTGR